ncbi:hypothetical protein KIL84_013953, partial [Mauremys mutica]
GLATQGTRSKVLCVHGKESLSKRRPEEKEEERLRNPVQLRERMALCVSRPSSSDLKLPFSIVPDFPSSFENYADNT